MDYYSIIVTIVAVSAGFFVQSIVGFAAALVSYPLLLTILTMQDATALISVYFLLFSVFLVYKNWKDINKKLILDLSWTLVLGMILGVILLKYGNPIVLKKFLGIFVVLFAVYTAWGEKKVKLFRYAELVFGFIGGLSAGLFSAGGPPLVIYITSKESKASIIRATTIGVFGITNLLRLPLLVTTNILTWQSFISTLYIFPFFLIALYLGQKTYHKINEKTFKNFLLVILFFSGISLILS